MRRMLGVMAICVALALGVGTAGASTVLVNGSFETGDFTGWSAFVSGSNGTIEVRDTATAPISGFATAAPTDGDWHAVTGQSGPGAYALIQSFVVPTNVLEYILTFDMFANNYDTRGVIDGGLDPFAGVATQHARVDILTAGATPFDTAGGVVATLLAPFADAGPNPNPYTSYVFDLLPLLTEGTAYQLRFAHAETNFHISMGVDNVSLTVTPVPLPAGGALLFTALAGLVLLQRRKKVA